MCMDMISALAVYYATDVWHGYKLFGMTMSSMFIVAPLMVAAVVMFPLARVMMDKKSKQFAFRMGLPFYIAGGIMMAVMDPSWAPPILVPIIAFMMGLGFGGAQMMPWIIFPDTVDVAEMATGERPTGTPIRIISEVEIIFSTIFWAVPLFILLEPVTNSGPTIVSMGKSEASAKGVLGLLVIQPVRSPFSRA